MFSLLPPKPNSGLSYRMTGKLWYYPILGSMGLRARFIQGNTIAIDLAASNIQVCFMDSPVLLSNLIASLELTMSVRIPNSRESSKFKPLWTTEALRAFFSLPVKFRPSGSNRSANWKKKNSEVRTWTNREAVFWHHVEVHCWGLDLKGRLDIIYAEMMILLDAALTLDILRTPCWEINVFKQINSYFS